MLVLDQFEELFTLQSKTHRNTFIDQLSHLVRGVRPPQFPSRDTEASATKISDSPPAAKIVLSLREDFLAELDALSDRIPGVLDERFRLLPLSRAAASRALAEPARFDDVKLTTRPFELDSGAETAILDFHEHRTSTSIRRTASDIEPFQLQLICRHLEKIAAVKQEAGTTDRVRVTLEDVGGESHLRRILKNFFKEQVAAIPLRQRYRVKRLCGEFLINLQGRRLRMEESEIKRLLGVQPNTLKTLVDGRLLRADQTADGTYYELSHDSLIKPILDSRHAVLLIQSGLLFFVIVIGGVYGIFLILFPLTIFPNIHDILAPSSHDSQEQLVERMRIFRVYISLSMMVGLSILGGIVLFVWVIGKARKFRENWRRWRI